MVDGREWERDGRWEARGIAPPPSPLPTHPHTHTEVVHLRIMLLYEERHQPLIC